MRNPFHFGALALDDAFTDREREVKELCSDIENGQDVVLFAPRRYGKSSLIWRVSQVVAARKVLVAQVDLMKTPTKQKLAEKLAHSIHEDVASVLIRAKERLRVFADLRITPIVTVNPNDGSVSFSFSFAAGSASADIDGTIEQLLELPAHLAAERGRRVALVFDEFQEIVEIDPGLPKLMRAVFQEQPEVGHVYLGSKRHMMERIFNDENEPFWRSAKQMELGPIPPELFAGYVVRRFEQTRKTIVPEAVDDVLELTKGHPYATQELCYFLWEETPARRVATPERLAAAVDRVLRSEHTHFSLLWDRAAANQKRVLQALAREAGHPFSEDYRRRHGLPSVSSTQKAVEALARDELIGRDRGRAWIAEPFLAEWIRANVQ